MEKTQTATFTYSSDDYKWMSVNEQTDNHYLLFLACINWY